MRNLTPFVTSALLFSACSSTDLGNREPAQAKLPLNLKDEVPGLTIGNTHEVFHGPGRLIRGAQPTAANFSQLASVHTTDVVIFKYDTKGEVAQEIQDLARHLPQVKVTNYPMSWNEIVDDVPCRYTVNALNDLMAVARTPGRVGYFHCSYGEDRSGLLAGLLRMTTQGWTADKAFHVEMCPHGFGLGDTVRDPSIGVKSEAGLVPIFLQIAWQLQGRPVNLNAPLDPAMCDVKPKTPLNPAPFTCK